MESTRCAPTEKKDLTGLTKNGNAIRRTGSASGRTVENLEVRYRLWRRLVLDLTRIIFVLAEKICRRRHTAKAEPPGCDAGERGSRIIVGANDCINIFLFTYGEDVFNLGLRIVNSNSLRRLIGYEILKGQTRIIMEQKPVLTSTRQGRNLSAIAMRSADDKNCAHNLFPQAVTADGEFSRPQPSEFC
ncbi:hypothetical protein BH20ACI3_BH20ACI3_19290 [soil metagenome]